MEKFLFIGGSNNGKRLSVPKELPIIHLPKVGESKGKLGRIEKYYPCYFFKKLIVYRHESIDTFEMMELLIKGYK